MKLPVLACLILLLPALLHCQAHDPVLDSLKHSLPSDASATEQAKRLQAVLRYIFFSNEFVFGDFPKQLDSLHQCCIAGKTGDRRFEKMVEADVSFYKGAAILYEQPAVAESFFQPALRQYEVLGDSAKEAMVHMGRCIAASGQGDSLAFAGAYERGLPLGASLREPYELANLYNTLGMSCYDFGRYAESIQLDFEILELIDRNPTPKMLEGKPGIYHNIGSVYGRLGDYTNARLYAEKSVKEAAATKQDLAEYQTGLAWAFILERNYTKALEVFQSILKSNPVPLTLNQIAASTYSMATCYRNLGDMKQALPLAKKGVELLPIHQHASYGSAALQELAFCEFELGMTDSALQHALLAFQTFSSANNNLGSVEAAELLSRIYKQKNDYRKALEYSELRYQFQNLIERQQSTRQLAFGEFTRENEVKNAQREAEVQAQLTRQRNIRYALFAGLGVLALLAFLLYNRFRFKQRTAAQLEAKNREVEAARLRAEKSEAFKSRFLANMSHEIRTPLHGISGYTDLLLETSLTEKQRRYLTSVRHSNERLTEVVNDILDISKLEAGEVRLRQVPFSPARIAEDVREALSVRAENKGIELKVDIGEDVPEAVLGDPTRLYQILMNLAGNAVKFTEKGGVELAVRQLAGRSQYQPIPYSLLFTVKDTGIGVPAEKLSTIFDSFQQAEGDTTARFGGTGLGLTIARELVQLHGSDIHVESEVGKGSTFSFMLNLPLADAADLESKKAGSGDLFFTQPLKILLADDNDFNREIAREALLRHFENMEIVEAVNGKEAVTQLENQDFDLVLMDMQMPEMNGIEAARHIREHLPDGKKNIPIIALTASATPEEIEKALASGMNRHLGKPFKPHELAQAIAEVLGLGVGKDFPSFKNLESLSVAPVTDGKFDLRFLRDFCNGDEVQVRFFIEKFETQCPLEIGKLEAAFQQEDRKAIYEAAHSFRPQLEFVGLAEAARLAAEMEQGTQEGRDISQIMKTFTLLMQTLNLKRLAPAFLLLLLPIFLFCQSVDPVLDSLKRPLPKAATARQQAERLQAILWQYIRRTRDIGEEDFPAQLDSIYRCCLMGKTGNDDFEKAIAADATFFRGSKLINTEPEAAKPLIESAIRKYRSLGDSAKAAVGYMQLSYTVWNLGDSIAFANVREQALRLLPFVQDDYMQTNILAALGIGCYDFGRYAEAASHYFEALKIIEKGKTAELMTGERDFFHNLGGVYSRLGDWDNALLYIRKAIESAKQTQQDTLDHYLILARTLIEKKAYSTALRALKLTENHEFAQANSLGMSQNAYSQATCYRHLGKLDSALFFAQKSVKLLPVSINATYGAAALVELATCEFELGMDSALHHALSALKTLEWAKYTYGLVKATELISNIYKSKGDYRKALEYSELRYRYQNQIERQQSTRQLAFGEFTRDNAAQTARREAEVQAQLTRQRNIRYALFAGLGVLALLAFLLYNRFRFKQRTAAQLEAKNREVEAARQRAEKSEAFKSRFLANMSHEIRTPLHGIAGYTDLLLETSLTEKQRRYLNSVQHSNERLTEVVNDILDISKLEAGEVKLRQVPFSPAQICEDVREALAPRAESKGIALNLNVGENLPAAVLGDPTRLYQVLMNLAGNAVKFTSVGSVQLAVGSQHPPNSNSLIFIVKDSGIGIPPEKLSSIFDSFQQAEGDTTARFGGTGLGLTIARELVQLHGSDIRVESEVGKGSIFSFTLSLPLANAADLEQIGSAGGDLYFTQPLKILLADDNAFNREIATEALLRHFENVEIVEMINGKEVIESLEKGTFDLVLMDMQMPEVNGTEATRHIRQHLPEGKNGIPIIALTASATPEEIEKALESGMNRHLAKPFKPHELARAIANTLGLSSVQKTSEGFATLPTLKPTMPYSRYDLTYLLDFCNSDEEQVQYFIERFEAQCPLEIGRLEAAFLEQDREAIYRTAHSLKPQLEFVGLKEAAGLAAEMERGARGGLGFGALSEPLEQLKVLLRRRWFT